MIELLSKIVVDVEMPLWRYMIVCVLVGLGIVLIANEARFWIRKAIIDWKNK